MARGLSPQSAGQRVFMTFLIQCIVSLFDCVFVLSPAIDSIFHTPMARYSLFVLKVPLTTNQPANQLCCVVQTKSELSILSNMHGSARYIAFIQKLGDVLRLSDCDSRTTYLGGLDHRGTDGPFAYCWRAEFMQGEITAFVVSNVT